MSGANGRAFHDLEIYRRYELLSDLLWAQVETWSARRKALIGDQLLQAADSIGANIAESVGRGHSKDGSRFLYIARGSMAETEHWIRRAIKRGLIDEKLASELRPLCTTLHKQLNAFIRAQAPSGAPGASRIRTDWVHEDASTYDRTRGRKGCLPQQPKANSQQPRKRFP